MTCFSGKKTHQFTKGWFLFCLIFISCLFITHQAQAANVSEFVPAPEITSFTHNQTLSGDVVVSGTSINYSQVKFYLDGEELGYAQTKIGSLGWQDFELALPSNMEFGQHTLESVTEYFNNTQSTSTILAFNYADKFPAPTLFNPVLNSETNFQQPWIVGLSYNDAYLECYIDDQYVGQTQITNHESGVADFKYKPTKKLSRGFHTVKVKAIGLDGRQSDFSNEIVFEVRQGAAVLSAPDLPKETGEFIAPVPAPTLVKPKNGSVDKDGSLLMAGLTHNEHFVKVYVDEELVDQFMPEDHESGVTSFTWQNEQVLEPGLHKVWVTATNPRGQLSGESNILRILVLPAEHFVSQGGQIAGATPEQPASDVQEEDEQKTNGIVDTLNGWANWWKYLIALIVIIAVILIIVWFSNYRKDEYEEEKIVVKTPDKPKPQTPPAPETKKTEIKKEEPPVIQGPEINYDSVKTEDVPPPPDINERPFFDDDYENGDEHTPPPPPPVDSPTLGI